MMRFELAGAACPAAAADRSAINSAKRGKPSMRRSGHARDRCPADHPDVGCHLTNDLIWTWSKSFHQCIGDWPTKESAFTDPSGREKWSGIDLALRKGHRGLPGGSSLARLLAQHGVKA